MAKTLDVTISPKGEVNVEAQGYSGSGCVAATKFVTDALGSEIESSHTPDYAKAEETHLTAGAGDAGGGYSGV
jgi:hypothetical protein